MPPSSEDVADRLAWSTWPQAIAIIARGRTRRPALRVALVVGTLLTLVNLGAGLLHGPYDADLVARVAANYAIPYVVSSIGLLNAFRRSVPPVRAE